MMKAKTYMLLIGCLLVLKVQGQEADQILARYFKNTGGLRAWKNLRTMQMEGVFPSPQGRVSFTIYKKIPDLIKMQVNIRGETIVLQAYDGETAWISNPMVGGGSPQQLPDAVAEEVAANAEFQDALIDYKSKGHVLTYEGKEQAAGVETYVLKLEKNKNNSKKDLTEYHYFDTEHYLPVMISTIDESDPEGKVVSITYLSDYQETEGRVTMPHHIETQVNGQKVSEIIFNSIEINKTMRDDTFAFPGTRK